MCVEDQADQSLIRPDHLDSTLSGIFMYRTVQCTLGLVDFGTKLERQLAKLVRTILNPLVGLDFFQRVYNFQAAIFAKKRHQ